MQKCLITSKISLILNLVSQRRCCWILFYTKEADMSLEILAGSAYVGCSPDDLRCTGSVPIDLNWPCLPTYQSPAIQTSGVFSTCLEWNWIRKSFRCRQTSWSAAIVSKKWFLNQNEGRRSFFIFWVSAIKGKILNSLQQIHFEWCFTH